MKRGNESRLDIPAKAVWIRRFDKAFFVVRLFKRCQNESKASTLCFQNNELEKGDSTNSTYEMWSVALSPFLGCVVLLAVIFY